MFMNGLIWANALFCRGFRSKILAGNWRRFYSGGDFFLRSSLCLIVLEFAFHSQSVQLKNCCSLRTSSQRRGLATHFYSIKTTLFADNDDPAIQKDTDPLLPDIKGIDIIIVSGPFLNYLLRVRKFDYYSLVISVQNWRHPHNFTLCE
jgi:hypothetical protein